MQALLTLAWVLGAIYSTIPAFWLAIHPFAERWRARRGNIYNLLGLIWLAEIILVLAITRGYRFESFYSATWTWAVWAALFVGGLLVYRRIGTDFGVRRFLGKSELRPEENEQRLITTGMHGRVRHPIYLAHLCMLTAWTVGSGLKVLFAMWLFGVITGAAMIRMEERELELRFGDEYRSYKKRVPAVLPR